MAKKLNKEINDNDFKLCFDILAPCIGGNKSSVNFSIIQNYLLALLKELVNKGNKEIQKTMFKLRHKTLFELIFMTIVLFNSDNSDLKKGFEYFPQL